MVQAKVITKQMISRGAGERLSKVRRRLNYSSPEMAARLGISGNAYNKNELGTNFPSVNTLHILHKEYDVSLDWFFFNKGSMHYQTKVKEGEMELEKKGLKEEGQRLKEEEKRLEKEAEKIKKMGESAAKFVELEEAMPDITDLLEHMAADPQLGHKVLLDFYTYKKEKDRVNPGTPVGE
ncbi:MAG: helix-turn-helix transcriptional regulator [bacterium]|nr:helix-turn-helix transcriptional regulator [bacterium]